MQKLEECLGLKESKHIVLQIQAGPSLTSQLSAAVVKLAESTCVFIEALLKTSAASELNKHVGLVFERCQDLSKAATDNRTAIGRKLLQVCFPLGMLQARYHMLQLHHKLFHVHNSLDQI